MNICPICIDTGTGAEYITKCKHGYCMNCLCRIKNVQYEQMVTS
jgi:hypothetical protein